VSSPSSPGLGWLHRQIWVYVALADLEGARATRQAILAAFPGRDWATIEQAVADLVKAGALRHVNYRQQAAAPTPLVEG